MALIVQKYGGTSVADIECIRNVATRVKSYYDKGDQIVLVVSARSGVTNNLINMARQLNAFPNKREMDMLLSVGEQETIALTALAIDALGIPAISKTGAQAGIMTDEHHTKARIRHIDCGNIPELLRTKHVVIVAGFQGMNHHGSITTLGRGGSDLTAIALAHALRADLCQIYTDVEGVYTADPRIVKDARKLDCINYEEMLELTSMGSRVMQARAVEFAQKYRVTFEVRSAFEEGSGTIIMGEYKSMESPLISGIALDEDQSKIVVVGLPSNAFSPTRIFEALAQREIIVDMISQSMGGGGLIDLSFTVKNEDVRDAMDSLEDVVRELGSGDILCMGKVAKVSAVGVGMKNHTGIAHVFFKVLAEEGISIELITTSEIKISVAIPLDKGRMAVKLLHDAFNLENCAKVLN